MDTQGEERALFRALDEEEVQLRKAKKYLLAIRKSFRNIEEQKAATEALALEHAKLTASYSAMPRSGRISDTSDVLCRIEEATQVLAEMIAEKDQQVVKALKEIQALDDDDYEAVLTAYYINCLPMATVAKHMGYSLRHTLRIHAKALAAFEKAHF